MILYDFSFKTWKIRKKKKKNSNPKISDIVVIHDRHLVVCTELSVRYLFVFRVSCLYLIGEMRIEYEKENETCFLLLQFKKNLSKQFFVGSNPTLLLPPCII